MKHGSLFNGIGGFQIAAALMGWENIFSCEIDDFCNIVTKYHFPNCTQHIDIRTTNFKQYEGKIDILTGGFPCQPFSVAGKRLGAEDDRNLWSEMYRAITEIQPRWVVAENVRGIINWNGGVVFKQVHDDLEAAGYEVQSFVLPAASVGAPHKRERVFFVAYNPNTRIESVQRKGQDGVPGFEFASDTDSIRKRKSKQNQQAKFTNKNGGEKGVVANTEMQRRKLCNSCETERTQNSNELFRCKYSIPNWDNFPTQSPICGGDDGIPKELDSITVPGWRRQAIKAYGNAVVVPLVLQIFKAINEYEN